VTAPEDGEQLPAIPASAGAMIFDPAGRLLILKPVYKSGWTIPGGVMEIGETPWSACQREVREESGLVVRRGRLACVDFRPPRPGKPGGLRFLFDCGTLPEESLAAIVLQPEEISKYRIEPLPAALDLLRKPIRRRVSAAIGSNGPGSDGPGSDGPGSGGPGSGGLCYLENGRPVPGVGC
jgi:8-oxo-dGTP diphosphatase